MPRTIAQARRALEMMCERALSRVTKGEVLANKQMVQEKIADSWIQLRQFRLLVLETAWMIDRHHDYKLVRKNIAAVKAVMPGVLHDIAARALHLTARSACRPRCLSPTGWSIPTTSGSPTVRPSAQGHRRARGAQKHADRAAVPGLPPPCRGSRARDLYGDLLDALEPEPILRLSRSSPRELPRHDPRPQHLRPGQQLQAHDRLHPAAPDRLRLDARRGRINNLAPFSFFTGVSANPPVVGFSPMVNLESRLRDSRSMPKPAASSA